MSDELLFEWDGEKDRRNVEQGRPSFEEATRFDLTTALVAEDVRQDYGEERIKAIGLVDDRHHVLVYTRRGERIRVISFRKANDREIRRYDRHTESLGENQSQS